MSTLKLVSRNTDEITFADLGEEHDYKKFDFWTLASYVGMLIELGLSIGFLASDIYTLIQIYALNDWDSYHAISYVPLLVYRVVFTVCIGLSMVWMIANWCYGAHIYKTNSIVRSHLNDMARQIHSLKSYERFCIYERSTTKSTFDWAALTIYRSFHFSIYLWLFADTPRQILNGATIAYSISNSFTSSDIVQIVVEIGKSNKREAVLLSFMTFSFVVWLIFTVKNILAVLGSFYIVPTVHGRHHMTLRKYCRSLVAGSVFELYEKHEMELRKKQQVLSKLDFKRDDPFDSKFDLQQPTYSKSAIEIKNVSNDSLPSFPEDPFNDVISVSHTKQNRALAEKLEIPYPQELVLNDSYSSDSGSFTQKSGSYASRKTSDHSISYRPVENPFADRNIYSSASLDQTLKRYT